MRYLYYGRVSTVQQNSSRQTEAFKSHGYVNATNVFIDKVQGNVPFFERENAITLYKKMLECEDSVTLVVCSIDRLGRNLVDILKTIEVFTDQSICIKSLKEGLETINNGTENPVAKLIVSVLGSIAEIERNRIRERMMEGISLAKANGKYKGRKVGSTALDSDILKKYRLIVDLLKKGTSVRNVSKITSKSTGTIMKVKKILDKQAKLLPA